MKTPDSVCVARQAMATRFEVLLHGENEAQLRAAGEEALDEVERLEGRLSLYRPASEIARVNALAARQPVRVSPPVFALLAQARSLHDETAGAFDITIGPLVRCWGFMGGPGQLPDADSLAAARALVGMRHVELDQRDLSVRFDREGVMIDLGAIGKGYAIDCAVRLLREFGITSALIHGGTSTIYAIGAPPGAPAWQVEVASAPDTVVPAPPPWAVVRLRDEALSVSAGWGKSFAAGGKTYGHVLDPRTGEPVADALLAAVALPSATETDALSTALLVAGAPEDRTDRSDPSDQSVLRPGMRTLLVTRSSAGSIVARGNLGNST